MAEYDLNIDGEDGTLVLTVPDGTSPQKLKRIASQATAKYKARMAMDPTVPGSRANLQAAIPASGDFSETPRGGTAGIDITAQRETPSAYPEISNRGYGPGSQSPDFARDQFRRQIAQPAETFLAHGAANLLPAAGAVIGSGLGSAVGPLGSVAGGLAGFEGVRRIQQNLLGEPTDDYLARLSQRNPNAAIAGNLLPFVLGSRPSTGALGQVAGRVAGGAALGGGIEAANQYALQLAGGPKADWRQIGTSAGLMGALGILEPNSASTMLHDAGESALPAIESRISRARFNSPGAQAAATKAGSADPYAYERRYYGSEYAQRMETDAARARGPEARPSRLLNSTTPVVDPPEFRDASTASEGTAAKRFTERVTPDRTLPDTPQTARAKSATHPMDAVGYAGWNREAQGTNVPTEPGHVPDTLMPGPQGVPGPAAPAGYVTRYGPDGVPLAGQPGQPGHVPDTLMPDTGTFGPDYQEQNRQAIARSKASEAAKGRIGANLGTFDSGPAPEYMRTQREELPSVTNVDYQDLHRRAIQGQQLRTSTGAARTPRPDTAATEAAIAAAVPGSAVRETGDASAPGQDLVGNDNVPKELQYAFPDVEIRQRQDGSWGIFSGPKATKHGEEKPHQIIGMYSSPQEAIERIMEARRSHVQDEAAKATQRDGLSDSIDDDGPAPAGNSRLPAGQPGPAGVPFDPGVGLRKKASDDLSDYFKRTNGYTPDGNSDGSYWVYPDGTVSGNTNPETSYAAGHPQSSQEWLDENEIKSRDPIKTFMERTGSVRLADRGGHIGIEIRSKLSPEQIASVRGIIARATRNSIGVYWEFKIGNKSKAGSSVEEFNKAAGIITEGQPGPAGEPYKPPARQIERSGPVSDTALADGAEAYNRTHGLAPIGDLPYERIDPRAHQIADAYDAMEHKPSDPAVAKSYTAMKSEIRQQWDHATRGMGITFEPWARPGQPYANSKEMSADVRDNRHLYFFQGGEMPADHPLAQTDPETGLTYNDMLRAVHDLFGHAVHGYEFGPRGEENAWIAHSKMFTRDALPAVTTETKGQNSWVNFGAHLRNAEGAVPAKGQPGYISPTERPFAQQKAGILPSQYHARQGQPAPEALPEHHSARQPRAEDGTFAGPPAQPKHTLPTPEERVGKFGGGTKSVTDTPRRQKVGTPAISEPPGTVIGPGLRVSSIGGRFEGPMERQTRKNLERARREGRRYPEGMEPAMADLNTEDRQQAADWLGAQIISEGNKDRADWMRQMKAAFGEHYTQSQLDTLYRKSGGRAKTTDQIVRRIENAALTPITTARALLGTSPEYIPAMVEFMKLQREKLLAGKMTNRDLAKAYALTVASQRGTDRGAYWLTKTTGGMFLPPYAQEIDGQYVIRPEEAMASWMFTDRGQAALNAIEDGRFDEKAWGYAGALRKAFGDDRFNSLNVFGNPKPGAYNMTNISEVTRKVNEAKEDIEKITEALRTLNGIGDGKIGFIKYMLGMGDASTIDAAELSYWVAGQGELANLHTREANLAREIKDHLNRKAVSKAIVSRIQRRLDALVAAGVLPDGVPPEFARHIIHQWMWDSIRGSVTSHFGMQHALLRAKADIPEPGSRQGDLLGTGPTRFSTVRTPAKLRATAIMHHEDVTPEDTFNRMQGAGRSARPADSSSRGSAGAAPIISPSAVDKAIRSEYPPIQTDDLSFNLSRNFLLPDGSITGDLGEEHGKVASRIVRNGILKGQDVPGNHISLNSVMDAGIVRFNLLRGQMVLQATKPMTVPQLKKVYDIVSAAPDGLILHYSIGEQSGEGVKTLATANSRESLRLGTPVTDHLRKMYESYLPEDVTPGAYFLDPKGRFLGPVSSSWTASHSLAAEIAFRRGGSVNPGEIDDDIASVHLQRLYDEGTLRAVVNRRALDLTGDRSKLTEAQKDSIRTFFDMHPSGGFRFDQVEGGKAVHTFDSPRMVGVRESGGGMPGPAGEPFNPRQGTKVPNQEQLWDDAIEAKRNGGKWDDAKFLANMREKHPGMTPETAQRLYDETKAGAKGDPEIRARTAQAESALRDQVRGDAAGDVKPQAVADQLLKLYPATPLRDTQKGSKFITPDGSITKGSATIHATQARSVVQALGVQTQMHPIDYLLRSGVVRVNDDHGIGVEMRQPPTFGQIRGIKNLLSISPKPDMFSYELRDPDTGKVLYSGRDMRSFDRDVASYRNVLSSGNALASGINLNLLRDPKMRDMVLAQAADLLNLPRALGSSGDLSAVLRQGLILSVVEPVAAAKATGAMLSSFAGPGATERYENVIKSLRLNANAGLAKDSGLYISSREQGGHDTLNAREEAFMSKLAEKLPWVKFSEQAYVAYLDVLRQECFDRYVEELRRSGIDLRGGEGKASVEAMAKFINICTGRGDLPGFLKDSAPLLNGVFFSPKLVSSRVQVLNPATYAAMPKPAAKIALRKMAQFIGVVGIVMGLAKLAGAEVSTDPENPDFMKIKVGNTRYDVLGGLVQPARFGFRFAFHLYKNFTGGKNKQGNQPLDIAQRFTRSKLSPTASYAYDAMTGKDFSGKKFKPFGGALERVVPMIGHDVYDAFKDEGMPGVAKQIPGFFGVGVSTYHKTTRKAD